MTELYLACAPNNFRDWDFEAHPLNLLIAFPFADKCLERIASGEWRPARMMLDSGAWSAFNSGVDVDIDALIEESKRPIWSETVALDVIGDAEASARNADYMRARGSNAFPVFHIGEPWEVLAHYCANWPKVGLACSMIKAEGPSYRFYDQCFARHWPHLFHSFGWTEPKMLRRYPFDSADSTTWQVGFKFSKLTQFTGQQVWFKGLPREHLEPALRGEILKFLESQREMRGRWLSELEPVRKRAAEWRASDARNDGKGDAPTAVCGRSSRGGT